ncbi:Pre-mRNA-splicing factor SYF2 [Lithohypha guttulata]|nr:Pre-mRNA-splicing factor SYF2 [Lithohypha guttulata]
MKGWRRRSDHALNPSCHSPSLEAQQNLRGCLLNHKSIRRDTGEKPANQKQEAEAESLPAESRSADSDKPAEDAHEATPELDTEQTATSKPNGNDRLARFAALKKRATASAKSNLTEAKAEAQRAAVDPSILSNLSRRSAIAQHNLLKADTEEQLGTGAFERKRAWDYTIEESERWDERMAQKKEARDKNAFSDYGAEAAKIYDRQIRELEKQAAKDGGRNREEYQKQKAELIEQAARSGGLEIVEIENGELVAIDRDGRFYADENNTGFVEQKPNKENVDRLVEDIRKAEEIRLQKRKKRRGEGDDGDVTYINEKNKQFNLKLARFYDRYTTDIRESFERGTAV